MSEMKPLIPSNLDRLLEFEDVVAATLEAKVGTHEGSRDGFTLLRHDRVTYPFQDVRCYQVDGSSTDPATIHSYGRLATENYGVVLDAFRNKPALVADIRRLLREGKNLTVITGHRNVIGTAILGAALQCVLVEDETEDAIRPGDFETAIFANAMIKYTQMLGVPTAKVLADIFSRTLYTHPDNTAGEELSGIPLAVSAAINPRSAIAFRRDFGSDKPVLSLIAGSGRRDFRGPKAYHMGPANEPTAKMISDNYVITADLDITPEIPECYVGDLHEPYGKANAKEKLDELMFETAYGISEASVTPSNYHPDYESLKAVKAAA